MRPERLVAPAEQVSPDQSLAPERDRAGPAASRLKALTPALIPLLAEGEVRSRVPEWRQPGLSTSADGIRR